MPFDCGTRHRPSLQILRDPDYAGHHLLWVTWSPDGRFLASGSYMRGVQVWNVETGQRCWVGSTHPTRIRCVAWSPDGSRLASGGDDGRSVCGGLAMARCLLMAASPEWGGVRGLESRWEAFGQWWGWQRNG